jgi:hypothetical protein
MKTKLGKITAQRGSAMFTAMIIMGVLGLVTASMVYMATQQPFIVKKTREQLRAQAIAEAGANVAYAMLSTNFNLKDNPAAFPLINYRGGAYDVTVTSMSSTSAVISSTGFFNLAVSTVAMDVRNTVTNMPSGPTPPASGAFSYGIACGSSLNTGTSNAGTIEGDVIATSITDKKDKITGTETIGTITVNDLFSLTPYYNAAVANGTMFYGDCSFRDYAPPGGIAWVQGNVTLKGTITGCIIATGNITANGGFTQIKVYNYPALVSQNGNISGNNSTAHGLIYAKSGTVDLGGNFTVTGSVICPQAIDGLSGGSSVVYENSTPVPPGGGGTVSSVGISGWRQ